MTGMGFGHGKVILLGEHAVVYGYPALVTALRRGVTARVTPSELSGLRIHHQVGRSPTTPGDGTVGGTALAAMLERISRTPSGFDIHVECELPISVGLGSSAAFSVAIAQVLIERLGGPEETVDIEMLAGAAESVFHQRPSGVDVAGAARGTTLLFSRETEPTPVEVATELALVIARVEDAPPTSEVVAAVRERWRKDMDSYDRDFRRIGGIVIRGVDVLAAGQRDALGPLFDENQERLRRIGVSTPSLDKACEVAKAAGALGAKLTGAGGGGCIVALAGDDPDRIAAALGQTCRPVFVERLGERQ